MYSLWLSFNSYGVRTNFLKNKEEFTKSLTQKNNQYQPSYVQDNSHPGTNNKHEENLTENIIEAEKNNETNASDTKEKSLTCEQNTTADIPKDNINPQTQEDQTKKTTYKDIPLEAWHIILQGIQQRSSIFLTSRDFYIILLKIRCEKILYFNISNRAYHANEFSKLEYMKTGSKGFLESIFAFNQSVNWKDVNENNREIGLILNEHYNEQLPLFFLKFAHHSDILKKYNKYPLSSDTIILEEKFLRGNRSSCEYRVFTLNKEPLLDIRDKKSDIEKGKSKTNDRKKIVIMVKNELDSNLLNILLERHKNDNIIRILLKDNDALPFDLSEKGNPENQKVINRIQNIIIQQKDRKILYNPHNNYFKNYSLLKDDRLRR